MTATLSYVAAACNRFGQAADISPSSSIVAFGSSRFVALWDLEAPDGTGVYETLPGHNGLITCVKFLSDEWKIVSTVQVHSKSVSTVSVQGDRIVTGSSDSSVKIWTFRQSPNGDEIVKFQALDLKGKYPLASALSYLPQTIVSILAISGTDGNVRIWVCSEEQYLLSATLAGHEDWVRTLAFKPQDTMDSPLVLASGSQDATIRLWNIEPWKKTATNDTQCLSSGPISEILDQFEASLGDLGESEEGGRQISLKQHILTVKTGKETSQQFSVTFDALLIGHEAGITSLSWRPGAAAIAPTLLSTSTDSSVILWSPASALNSLTDSSSSIWINRHRFGDVGGQRFGGFVGGLWARGGSQVLAWGWAGGWRRWAISAPVEVLADENWDERNALSGHSGPVKGLDWSPDGKYIISTGLDQTTRIHAPVRIVADLSSWHEIARPQVHGYDLLNVVFINPLKFASIADEKVLRVFEAPRTFVNLAERLGVAEFSEQEHQRPVAANVPPLGLSNKAINDGPEELVGEIDYSRPPFEGELASMTLWPEVDKVFGHGYESITLGISNSRTLLATACKSTSAEHAAVRVYSTTSFKLVGEPLYGHVLTVTRIAFSPDDKYILTVSRDRSWRLFERQEEGGFKPVAADKSHGRIIWDCSWSADGDIFATASRDKTVKIWHKIDGDKWEALHVIKTQQPSTAVAFTLEKGLKRSLAIGLENGEIIIYSQTSSGEWVPSKTIPPKIAHIDHIHRMAWRPSTENNDELATCSEDGTLRIIKV
ncbi:hypothetical protein CVT26_007609 [Gymnopilus dilepis]|uniref:Elongator complex protein 2 n=1 Tax=Gymnopilus dilepis TaxID=231916 RepID=A0A409VZV6_9AGAR|nr:hypothetical protein CVT26_007609 [Gymnopilus dilepis]